MTLERETVVFQETGKVEKVLVDDARILHSYDV